MMIALACDHGGFYLMQEIKAFLETEGYHYEEFGTFSTESCDYPDYAIPAAKAVAAGLCDRGILICTTGIGMSIIANKVPGIRAALCTGAFMAEMTRRHNNANVLALGARVTESAIAIDIVRTFLNTDFEGEPGSNHVRRVGKINLLDETR
jgi:ribose 5-phosphate isomerase B